MSEDEVELVVPKANLLRFRLRNWVANYPALYFPLRSLLGRHSPTLLSDATAITIEGYPRSANSFALRAFELSNPGIHVASHTHAPAQVKRSIRRGLPTLVVIREPEEAAKAVISVWLDIPPRLALGWYLMFYREILDLLPDLVLATFQEVTGDFGSVVNRINARFGSRFQSVQHTPELTAAVFNRFAETGRANLGGKTMPDVHLPKPSAVRSARKQNIRLDDCADLLEQARKLYAALMTSRTS